MPSRVLLVGHAGDAQALAAQPRRRAPRDADRAGDGGLRRALAEPFAGREPDITEENLQARIRGNLLMALSNKFGWLVLTTGNKSENSVGYSTLYGDSAGGFAVIKDVPKTLVYRARRRSRRARRGAPSRARSSTRPPSAELRDDQRDADSLPPTTTRSTAILEAYVEDDPDREQLVARGLPAEAVDARDPARRPRRVQAPPGPAGHQDHPAGVRPRPADADHQPLPAAESPRAAGDRCASEA